MNIDETFEFLDNLKQGDFCTINIPLYRNQTIPVTAMYVGKNEEGKYHFIDTGRFAISKEFLERGKVTIDKEYNGDDAVDIYAKFKMEQEMKRKQKQKNKSNYR